MQRIAAALSLTVMFLLLVVPVAKADSFGPILLNQTNNPCQGSTCVPTVANIANVSAIQLNNTQVQFTVTALSGFSIQLQSNDFFDFNTNIVPLSALSLDGGTITVFGNGGQATVAAVDNTTVVGQAGTGQFSLGLNDTSNPPKINGGTVTGASQIQFVIDLGPNANYSTLMASNFYPQPNAQGYNFEVHFCYGGSYSCGNPTGFATDSSQPVPEPASLALLGGGLLGLGGITRRRKK